MNEIKPDWKLLEHPAEFFYLFRAKEEKVKFIAKELMEKKFNLSDEFRTYPSIYNMLGYYLNGYSYSFFYEIRKEDTMQALLGFTNVLPGFKCEVLLKWFSDDLWSRDFVRQSEKVMRLVMKEFQLKRLHTETADLRIRKMAKMAGFKDNGIKPNDFRWDGELFPTYQLGIVEE